MPISLADMNTHWFSVPATHTVSQVLHLLPADQAQRSASFVIFPASDQRFYAVRWQEIEALARNNAQVHTQPLNLLAGLPQPVAAVEQSSMDICAARALCDQQPGKRLVVLSNGTPVGLLSTETPDTAILPPDPFVTILRRPVVLSANDDPIESSMFPPLEVSDVTTVSDTTAPTNDLRVINAWVDGINPNQSLQVRNPYELKFNVGARRQDTIAAVGGIGRALQEAAGDQTLVTILVVLERGDFTLYGVDSLEIVVPVAANEPSKNTVTFTIEAQREGTNSLNALFYVNGSLFQRLAISMQVGGQVPIGSKAMQSAATGITMGSIMQQPPKTYGQPVNVLMLAKDDGYQVIVQGGGVARAFLKVSAAEVAGWLKYARGVLHDIVHLQDSNGNYLYQDENTTIAPDIHAASLKKLAETGIYLFDELFYGNSGPDARAMGDLLKQLSQKHQLEVQIVSERFFFPWSLLYDGDDPETVDAQQFWGFKHVIEYMPEFSVSTPVSFTPTIDVGDTLDLAFVCNNGIDTQFGRPIVQGQREVLQALPGVSVREYPNRQDFINLLKDPNAPPLIYLYCHAVSKFPDEDGGVDDSRIALTDNKIMLREMKVQARTSLPPLSKAPLVFLNACESAELSPYLYDGLMPYLVARGVRGMIGTEVETPALFAAEFAKAFITRFTSGGMPLGPLLLDMRCEYLQQKNNVLGLVYALYSSGDVVVQRAE